MRPLTSPDLVPAQQADELDTFNTLMHENDALRTRTSAMGAQIADLETTNAEVRAEMSELRVKMADMLNRLNDLAESQGMHYVLCHDGLCTHFVHNIVQLYMSRETEIVG